MHELYLSIAGFIIKVVFFDVTRGFLGKYQLTHNIKYIYQGFIVNKDQVKHIHHTIIIKDLNSFDLLVKEKSTYIKIVYRQSSNITITWNHIGTLYFPFIVRRIINVLLAKSNGFTLHGSAVEKNGKALIFLGRSRAGKSTILTLLTPKFRPISDDSIIIRKIAAKYYCFQNPFIETEHWFERDSKKTEIQALLFLKKATDIKYHKHNDLQHTYQKLLEQLWVDEDLYEAQTKNLHKFITEFSSYFDYSFPKNRQYVVASMLKWNRQGDNL